jgi:UDP-N-acetylmuramoyl-tripeptide--D-alanyl-D-alanine ligase
VVTTAQRPHPDLTLSVHVVAAEHADAIFGLRERGSAIVNADDPRADVWRIAARDAGATLVTFGLDQPADIRARYATHRDGGALELAMPASSAHVVLHVPGRHMASNALAAAATAHAARLPVTAIVRGLETFRPVRGRLVTLTTAAGATVIDDTYNANPDSVRAAIDVLAARPSPRWLALGDMGEVGDEGPTFHREIGMYAQASGIERMLVAGDLACESARAFGASAEHFATVEALAQRVAADAFAGVTILVKGSRFMRMERVVAALTGRANGGAH